MTNLKRLQTIIVFGFCCSLVGNTKDLLETESRTILLKGEVISSGLDGYNRHNIALRYKNKLYVCVLSTTSSFFCYDEE